MINTGKGQAGIRRTTGITGPAPGRSPEKSHTHVTPSRCGPSAEGTDGLVAELAGPEDG